MAAGAAHTTAVSNTGAHWAWGANLGALGDGTTAQRHSPVPIPSPTGATLVVAGGAHSLAMTADGAVWSTGINLLGPLGSGGNASSTVYGPISGPAQAWGVMAPLLTPAGGTFTLPTSVAVTTLTPGAVIHYTTNGAEPTTANSSVASGGLIAVDQITLLNAKAFRTGMTASPVTTGTYTLQVATPSVAPGTGTYAAPQDVTIATATPDAALHYTLDGTGPDVRFTSIHGPDSGSHIRRAQGAWRASELGGQRGGLGHLQLRLRHAEHPRGHAWRWHVSGPANGCADG